MTVSATEFTPVLLDYLRQINESNPPILQKIRDENQQHRLGKMSLSDEQMLLLTWLARLIDTQNYLEIGTFTGYSSTAMALALPENARLTCCDINVTFTDKAQKYWQEAGVAHKITLHLQPALITLNELHENGQIFDFILIDADKPPTPHYFESCLKVLRVGGIMAIDNLLLNGRITETPNERSSASHLILQQFNANLRHDERIMPITLPLGDGLTLLMKK